MRLPARIAAAAALLLPATAQAQSDPAGSGPIVAALAWLQGTLLGTVATAVAVMAVAAVGFMMLTGAALLFMHIRRLRVHQAVKLGEER